MKTDYPRIERAEHGIEIPSPRNGKPGYRFVQGVYSDAIQGSTGATQRRKGQSMSKPAFFIVWVNGTQHRFEHRRTARLFAASTRLTEQKVIFKPVGF